MRQRSGALRLIQFMWPMVVLLVMINTIAMTWFGSPDRVSMWAESLPILSGLASLMAVAAGGGPLVADQIKAKAGILKGE